MARNNIIVEKDDLVIPPALSHARLITNSAVFLPATLLVLGYLCLKTRSHRLDRGAYWLMLTYVA